MTTSACLQLAVTCLAALAATPGAGQVSGAPVQVTPTPATLVSPQPASPSAAGSQPAVVAATARPPDAATATALWPTPSPEGEQFAVDEPSSVPAVTDEATVIPAPPLRAVPFAEPKRPRAARTGVVGAIVGTVLIGIGLVMLIAVSRRRAE